jgi:hypothetical protein
MVFYHAMTVCENIHITTSINFESIIPFIVRVYIRPDDEKDPSSLCQVTSSSQLIAIRKTSL